MKRFVVMLAEMGAQDSRGIDCYLGGPVTWKMGGHVVRKYYSCRRWCWDEDRTKFVLDQGLLEICE